MYAIEMGHTEKAILEQARAANGPVPQRIADAPDLELGLEFSYNAFHALSTDRAQGFGVSRIPWSSINRYCWNHGLEGDEREDFEYLIARMDEAYIKHFSDKAERERNKTPPRKVKTPPRRR